MEAQRDFQITSSRDYDIQDLTLISGSTGEEVDIREIFVSFEIFEDIEYPVLTGRIMLGDATGIIERIRIGRQDTTDMDQLKIKFLSRNGPEDVSFDKTFDITKISNRRPATDRSAMVMLDFISPEMTKNARSKISRSFKNKYGHEIIRDVLAVDLESTKEFDYEEDINHQSFISSWKHPIEIIKSAKNDCQNSELKSGFLFYENSLGFHLKTIDYMQTNSPKHVFRYYPSGLSRTGQDIESALRWNVVSEFSPLGDASVDRIRSQDEGQFGTQLRVYDRLRRKFIVRDISHTEEANPSSHQQYSVISGGSDNIEELSVVSNAREISRLYTDPYVFKIHGNSGRRSGDIFEFQYIEPRQRVQQEIPPNDPRAGGIWLIKKIQHTISREGYDHKIEAIKIADVN